MTMVLGSSTSEQTTARAVTAAVLDAVFANATDAIVLVDSAGVMTYATPAISTLLGFDSSSLAGATVFDFLHPDDLEPAADLFARRLEFEGQDQGKEIRIRHSSGAWVLVVATATLLPTDQLGACAITLRAVAESDRRELALRRRIVVAEFTNQLGADLMGAIDSTAVVERLKRSLGEIGLLTGAKAVGMFIELQEPGAVDPITEWRATDEVSLHPGAVLETGAAVEELLSTHVVLDRLNEVSADRHPALLQIAERMPGAGLLTTPFAIGGRRGTIVLLRFDETGWWDSDSELVRGVAKLCGRALQTAWSEELLALTYQLGPVGFSIRTRDGVLIDCNQRYLDLYGIDRETAARSSLTDLLLPDYCEPIATQLEALHCGEIDRFAAEVEVQRGDGSTMWARTNVVPMHVPGSSERFVLTAIENITATQQQRIELEYAATHDSLTGVANRAAMCRAIEYEQAVTATLPGLLIIDLDRFKHINDSMGHNAGDRVLQAVAERIAAAVRGSDTVARLGGDEFAIVAPGLEETGAARLAQRLLDAMARPIDVDGILVQQHLSIGVALGKDCDDLTDLMVKADRALYAAKGNGRGCSVMFDESMRDEVLHRMSMERELRLAISSDQLEPHFQPEFAVDDRRIVGAEALVRWRHPERGMIPAAEFIPVAERTGLIDEIGRLILRTAPAAFAAICQETDRSDLVLRVNISAREFARPELRDLVRAALDESGLAPDRLCLEMTETTLMDAPEIAHETMVGLHEIGVRFAIDDFGTGYSSLAYLKRFPVDAVKIDRAFVADIETDLDSRAIVESILGLARALSLEAVAEGVETDEQLATLRELGCDRAQGWLVAPAMPADELIELLTSASGHQA